ncbi:MAG: hypothetical protein AAB536_02115 [Patescibacteria group bacterium]
MVTELELLKESVLQEEDDVAKDDSDDIDEGDDDDEEVEEEGMLYEAPYGDSEDSGDSYQ